MYNIYIYIYVCVCVCVCVFFIPVTKPPYSYIELKSLLVQVSRFLYSSLLIRFKLPLIFKSCVRRVALLGRHDIVSNKVTALLHSPKSDDLVKRELFSVTK
jgi:hypothetical protein